MQYAVMLVPTLFTILSLGSVHVTMAADHSSHRLRDASPTVPVDVDALLRTHRGPSGWHAPGGPAPFALFSDSFASESSGGAEDGLRLSGGNDIAEDGEVMPGALERDWGGLGRDTAFFLGYEVVAAGILYLLPGT